MPLYECVLIARNDVTQQQVDAIADQVASVVGEQGGEVRKREYWGLRGLAYRIKKNRKGHYMLLGLNAKPANLSEMERQLRLNEDVLRFLTIRVDEIEEGPSAILSRKSEERGGERDRQGRPALQTVERVVAAACVEHDLPGHGEQHDGQRRAVRDGRRKLGCDDTAHGEARGENDERGEPEGGHRRRQQRVAGADGARVWPRTGRVVRGRAGHPSSLGGSAGGHSAGRYDGPRRTAPRR